MRGERYGISRKADEHRGPIVEQQSGPKTADENGLFLWTEKLGATCHIRSGRDERLQQEG